MRVRVPGPFVLGAACSAAVLAGGFAVASWLLPAAVPPPPPMPRVQAETRPAPAGGIASWPEIKNGVPEVMAPSTAPAAAPARMAIPVPAPNADPQPLNLAAPAPAPPAVTPARQAIPIAEPPPVPDPIVGLRQPEAIPEPPPLRGAAPIEVVAPARALVAAAPDAAAVTGGRDDGAVPALTPLPPRRPVLDQPRQARPTGPRQRAAAVPPQPGVAEPAPAPPEPAPPAERSILGVPIPNIIPSGQRVKECLLEFKC